MPLRDHFDPPTGHHGRTWDGFHGLWPAHLVQAIVQHLPANYFAMPTVRYGGGFEVDVAAFESLDHGHQPVPAGGTENAPQVWSAPAPTMAVETDLPAADVFEVLIFDEERERRLVAAVELVSPSNKDRIEHRRAFVGKCADLIRQDVSVSIVDVVTTRHFNLYTDVLDELGQTDPHLGPNPPPLYAATCRGHQRGPRWSFKTWAYPLTVGRALPTLPVWLTEQVSVPLELESTYQQTWRTLRVI